MMEGGRVRATACRLAKIRHTRVNKAMTPGKESRSIWAFDWLDALGMDLRLAVRAMRKKPGFFAILIVLIAGGIAATTAMFSIVESLLIRPLPYPEPEQLTAVRTTLPQGHSFPVTVPDF